MLLQIAGILFGVEAVLSIASAAILWYFWSRSAMERSVAIKAISIYGAGCVLFLLLAAFLPL